MEFVRDGGWPMIPVLLLGAGAVGLAIGHAARPSRTLFWAALGLAIGTLLAGFLGTVVGLIHSYGAVAMAEPSLKASLLARGISEAMNCTATGFGATILWLPPFIVGQVRRR